MRIKESLAISAAIVSIALFSPAWTAAADKPDDKPAASKAAETSPQDAARLDQHHEVPDDPYVKVPPESVRTTPATRIVNGPYFIVQVNVDENGNNIVGDAANEPTIAVDPTDPNIIAIGWRQFDTIYSNFRQAGWGYSTDNGRSWTFPGVIEPGIFRSDPVLDFDSDGNFFYNSLTTVGSEYVCDVFKSEDGGANWGSKTAAYGGDKQWMVIDRSGGIGDGNIYANWTLWWSSCNGQFTYSYDGGQTYEPCIDVPGEPSWGTLAVGPEGELYVCGDGWGGLTVARSTTLQDPNQAPAWDLQSTANIGGSMAAWGGPNPGGLLGQAWIGVDCSDGPYRGYVYLVCSVDTDGTDPMDVMFTRSTDGGYSWSSPVRLNEVQSGWQWFGTMSVAPNGRIDVIWNDTRNDPGGYDSELYYSYSTDGGASWSPNEALSPAWDPHIGWPQQDKIGDYYHMISDTVGANLAYSATFNGEQDVYYVRIGDFDCNGNGIGDTQDIDDGFSADCNYNGIPDECEGFFCDADVDNSCNVDIDDLFEILGHWGEGAGTYDVNNDGVVDIDDVFAVLADWGPC
ncbi:MAG: hypothetical protein JSV91_11585 [Phycisphaerales bacterium]|nr:MAG: hypothetical protein JSV91_11585 [Phycisphaerales bacterium]